MNMAIGLVTAFVTRTKNQLLRTSSTETSDMSAGDRRGSEGQTSTSFASTGTRSYH
jgi:hypothetical protein